MRRKLTQIQIVALGFFVIVCVGTVLLLLPLATQKGQSTKPLDAMFTAVSASCVTGLIRVDTATHWSTFGQIVIICLIQLGGLGYMTVATFFVSFARKRLGLKSRALFAESINTDRISNLRQLTKRIVLGTVLIEGLGAVLLSIRFIPAFGIKRGIYNAVFHSVSAFCNAGFDLMGQKEPFSSLVDFAGDWLVSLTVCLLIILGGIGFLVWDDVIKNGVKFRRYNLHTKIVLISSFVLTFGGALLFYLFDNNYAFAGGSADKKILCALFQSVTCRTAGFNTVDLCSLSDASVILSCFLMFIGGSSGSTAGGVKTTTMAVLLMYAFSMLRGTDKIRVFGRTIKADAVKKAAGVFIFNFMLVLTASLILCYNREGTLSEIMFETFSAMGTVGMSTGITRTLTPVSAITIMIMMFCGRVGSVSLATALMEKRNPPPVKYPEEEITVG